MKTAKCGIYRMNNVIIEEVYFFGYDTAGNYHWIGTRTGEHIIDFYVNYVII